MKKAQTATKSKAQNKRSEKKEVVKAKSKPKRKRTEVYDGVYLNVPNRDLGNKPKHPIVKLLDILMNSTVNNIRNESTQEIMTPKASPEISSKKEFNKLSDWLVAK